jgi:hypothetical protein
LSWEVPIKHTLNLLMSFILINPLNKIKRIIYLKP